MPYRGLPSTDHKVDRENDEIGCALVSERVPSKSKDPFKEKEKEMSAETQQQNQDYVATVEVVQPNGEWAVVARAVGTLEDIAEWAQKGVCVKESSSYTTLDSFTLPSSLWVDDNNDLVTDDCGNVVEPVDNIYAPYGYLYYGEQDGEGNARAQAPADPEARLLRIYPGMGHMSGEKLQEIIEESEEFYTVWAHPKPLEYSVEKIETYIRYAFGLWGNERVNIVPAADSEFRTADLLMDYATAHEAGELSEEDAQEWERVTELYFRHPYARKDR